MVVSVLLYGAETWTLKAQHVRRLNSFHSRCVRTILGVPRYQQWKERITSKHLASAFGMRQSIPDLIMEQQLRWLGHVGRMDKERLPKRVLFGGKRGRATGRRKGGEILLNPMWRLVAWAMGYVKTGKSGSGYEGMEKISRSRQKNTCSANSQPQSRRLNYVCGRSFRRQGDLTRHKHFCNHADYNLLPLFLGFTQDTAIMLLRNMGGFKVQGSSVCVCVQVCVFVG